MNKKHLIFIGAPGSGKGTQARKLVEEAGYKHISTGDILRKEISEGSDLGKEVKSVIDAGKLVNDELMAKLLKANIDLENESYIFDGYPRNISQAGILNKLLDGHKVLGLYFKVDIEDLIVRITNRRICQNCGTIHNLITKPLAEDGSCVNCQSLNLLHRKDDTEEVLRDRMQIFDTETSPVLKLYEADGNLVEVDASSKMSDIYKKIRSLI